MTSEFKVKDFSLMQSVQDVMSLHSNTTGVFYLSFRTPLFCRKDVQLLGDKMVSLLARLLTLRALQIDNDTGFESRLLVSTEQWNVHWFVYFFTS